MSKRVWVAMALVTATCLLIFWVYPSERKTVATSNSRPRRLVIRRLKPAPEAGGEVESNSGATVKFCYELKNVGRNKIDGLKLDLSCGCEATDPVPTQIAPGGTAVVCFQLRAPRFGTVERDVHLLAHGSSGAVATFPIALRVPVQPPLLLREGEPVELRVVAGDAASRELAFTTIEQRGSQQWFEGLSISPDDLARVESLEVDEFREPDPKLVRRAYRFRIEASGLAIGRHSGMLSLETRASGNPTPEAVYFTVHVLDRVTIVPNPLVISITPDGSTKPARAVVVFRNSEGTAQIDGYDDSLLEVRPVGRTTGRAISFIVLPVAETLGEDRNTNIIVGVGNAETRQLRVLLRDSDGE